MAARAGAGGRRRSAIEQSEVMARPAFAMTYGAFARLVSANQEDRRRLTSMLTR